MRRERGEGRGTVDHLVPGSPRIWQSQGREGGGERHSRPSRPWVSKDMAITE